MKRLVLRLERVEPQVQRSSDMILPLGDQGCHSVFQQVGLEKPKGETMETEVKKAFRISNLSCLFASFCFRLSVVGELVLFCWDLDHLFHFSRGQDAVEVAKVREEKAGELVQMPVVKR